MDENKTAQTETTEATGAENNGNENTGNPEITMDSLMAELATLKAENAKNKTALDRALHSNGELTKQLRAKMTASEQEAEAKREAEEAQAKMIQDLQNFKRKYEAKDRYVATIKMPADLAEEAAEAEVAGDMDALAAVYKRHQEAMLKQSEAEWLAKRPMPETGRDESKTEEDPFLAGFKG